MATSASSVTARHSPATLPGDTPRRHSPATLPPLSAAQGCRATLSGDTSVPFRRPRVPRDTPRRHFRPFPPPKGAARHSPVTLSSLSVAQGCHATLPGGTSAPFRRPRVPRDTPRRHFRPFPLPNGAARHSPVTLPTLSAAQGCRAMRQENYSNSLLSTATSTWILRAIRFVSTHRRLYCIP